MIVSVPAVPAVPAVVGCPCPRALACCVQMPVARLSDTFALLIRFRRSSVATFL